MNSQNIHGIATGASFWLVEIPTNSCRQSDQTSWPYMYPVSILWFLCEALQKGLFLELGGEPCGLHQKLSRWRSAQGLGQRRQQSREKICWGPNSNKIWNLSSIEWQFENRYMLNIWRQVFASVGYKVSFLLQWEAWKALELIRPKGGMICNPSP